MPVICQLLQCCGEGLLATVQQRSGMESWKFTVNNGWKNSSATWVTVNVTGNSNVFINACYGLGSTPILMSSNCVIWYILCLLERWWPTSTNPFRNIRDLRNSPNSLVPGNEKNKCIHIYIYTSIFIGGYSKSTPGMFGPGFLNFLPQLLLFMGQFWKLIPLRRYARSCREQLQELWLG